MAPCRAARASRLARPVDRGSPRRSGAGMLARRRGQRIGGTFEPPERSRRNRATPTRSASRSAATISAEREPPDAGVLCCGQLRIYRANWTVPGAHRFFVRNELLLAFAAFASIGFRPRLAALLWCRSSSAPSSAP